MNLKWNRPWMYPKQERAIFGERGKPEHRFSVIEASTKSGKSVSCLAWLSEKWFVEGQEGWSYRWVAPTFQQSKIMFRRAMRGLDRKHYSANRTEQSMTCNHNGAVMSFLGADRPDSLYGEDVHAAVIDEASRCFARGTPVDTPMGPVAIEELQPGDLVLTALGVGRVLAATRRRESKIAVTTVEGCDIVSSVDHRYLTQRGWVEARDLEPTDFLLSQRTAMRLLRWAIHTSQGEGQVLLKDLFPEGQGTTSRDAILCMVWPGLYGQSDPTTVAAILLSELFRTLADDATGDRGHGTWPGVQGEATGLSQGVLGSRHRADESHAEGAGNKNPNERPGGEGEGLNFTEVDRTPPEDQRREWDSDASRPVGVADGVGKGVLLGVLGGGRSGQGEGRASDSLPAGHRRAEVEAGDRGGRQLASEQAEDGGRQEGRHPDFARVDRVAILERGDPRFRDYSGDDGLVDLYDLEVSGHPSFSVNGFLVHNCKEEVWHAVRSTLTATRGPCRIIGNVKGRKNWAFRLARQAQRGDLGPDWEYHVITAYDAVQAGVLALEEIAQAKAVLPKSVFDELYMAIPTEDGACPFGIEYVRAATISPAVFAPGEPIVWGWDFGRKVDPTAGVALDAYGKVVKTVVFQENWPVAIERVLNETGEKPALVDATGLGDPIVQFLQQRSSTWQFNPFVFTTASRQMMLETLALSIQQAQVTWGMEQADLVSELTSFEYVHTRLGIRYECPEGLHDDRVMALGLANLHLRDPKSRPMIAW